MAFQQILEKIHQEARAEADKILTEARGKAQAILDEAEKEAERMEEMIREKAEKDSQLEAGRLVTQARLERNLMLLKSKKGLIDEVLDEAFQSVFGGRNELKKTLVSKTGETLEKMDPNRLKEDLRPELEPLVAELLGI